MSEDEISGSVIPMNLTVRYSFPFSALLESVRYLGGSQNLVLAADEALGTPIALSDDFQFTDSVEEFQHLRVLLTYLHEQFHLRHLTASPIGLLLYMIGGRQYAYIFSFLQRWGGRIGSSPAVPIRLPLNKYHATDPEVQEIKNAWDVFGAYQACFMESLNDITLLEVASGILRPLMEELRSISVGALGTSDAFPDIDLGEAHSQPANPGALTGRAVLEGLARMNEFATLAHLNAPVDLINAFVAEKQHGIYGQTIGVAGTLLNVSSVYGWMLVAKLSDWAMQAPIMPFLLRGRETVWITELLPAWRYFLLVSRFKESGFEVKDLLEREREVAAQLFGSLGWDDPWRVAERILQAKLPTPKSALTRHYVENLQLGAQLRLSNPTVMSFPSLGDQGHRLQAVFNIFADGIHGGTTGKLAGDEESWSLLVNLVGDATADALMLDEDLTRPLEYARLVSDFFGEKLTSGTLLSKALVECLGQAGAKRVLEATGFGVAGDATVWSARGRALIEAGRYEEALQDCERAIAIDQDLDTAWCTKGGALLSLGRDEEACEAYEKAIAINKNYALAWSGKGGALFVLGRWEEALRAFDKALAIDRSDAATWAGKGGALLGLSRCEEAMKACEKAIAINPGLDMAWYYRGGALMGLGRYEEAIEAWQETTGINKNYAAAWLWKGDALLCLQRYEEALQDCERAIEIDQGLDMAWCNKGTALFGLGRYKEALEAYEEAIAINENYALAWSGKGGALVYLGRYEEAVEACDKAIAIDRNLDTAWCNKGGALLGTRSYEEALEACEEAIAINPDLSAAWSNRNEAIRYIQEN